jgi:hypothetical protein
MELLARGTLETGLRALLIILMLLSLSPAQADDVQPKHPSKATACRKEAARKFIGDFVQAGPTRETEPGSDIFVTSYQNSDPQRFEFYVVDCMKRN